MKRIVNGKKYDTETARIVGEWSNVYGRGDFKWTEERLYLKRTGEYFLQGEGGAASHYSRSCGNNSYSSGSRIEPLTYDAARAWAEEKLSADEYEKIFGEIEEGSDKEPLTVYLNSSIVEALKREAQQTGKRISELITEKVQAAQ